MKNIFLLFFTLISLQATAQNSSAGFMGIVKVVDSTSPTLASTFYVKNGKSSTYFGSESKKDEKNQRIIIDTNAQTEISLRNMNGKKKAIKSKRQAVVLPQKFQNQKISAGEKVISKTGEKKVIDGLNCEKVIVKDNQNTVTAWLTKDVPLTLKNIYPINTRGFDLIFAAATANGIQNGLLMEATSQNNLNGKTSTIRTTIEKKKIKKKEFEIPSGYVLVDNTNAKSNVRVVSPMNMVKSTQAKIKATMAKMEKMKKAEGASEATDEVAPAPEKQ